MSQAEAAEAAERDAKDEEMLLDWGKMRVVVLGAYVVTTKPKLRG